MNLQTRAQETAEQALVHIPGDLGLPHVGATQRMLEEPFAFMTESIAKYGYVYKVRTVLDTYVAMLGPDALEFVLYREKDRFSSEQGWKPNLEKLFPGAVMMMDAPQHRIHRKLMAEAFKRPALTGYVPAMVAAISAAVAAWQRQNRIVLYEEIKRLFLSISIRTFFGIEIGSDLAWLDNEMRRMTAAVVFPDQEETPHSEFWYALRARERVTQFIRDAIAVKRKAPDASMLSHFCQARADDEYSYTDEDIVNHMTFMIMASHDTTSSAATSLVLLLADHPEWWDRVAEEVRSAAADDAFALMDLPILDAAFREALRLYPPVPAIPRVATEDITYDGLVIPKGARVAVYPFYNHRDGRYWSQPEKFDPGRFLRKEEAKHKYMFTPFGAGPHTCLGLVFAELITKIFLATLFRINRTITTDVSNAAFWIFPFPHPRGDAHLTLAA